MTSKPNGSRVQRARRKARERMDTLSHLVHGRRQAVEALVERARDRALEPVYAMPVVGNRVKVWLFNTAVRLVVWKIERDTFKTKFKNMVYEMGVDSWLKAMKGTSSIRL